VSGITEFISGPTVVGGRRYVTLGARLDANKGIGPGFDHLRIGLSLAVLFWHSFGLNYGITWTHGPQVSPYAPLVAMVLPMFFALSGFLVMGSALRINDLRTFIVFRMLRILPALATEITLSALILGPLMTQYSLARYFTDPRFVEYFGSLVGRVKYILPGLFMSNPMPEVVNAALATVGPEIACYILMSMLILTTLYRRPFGLLAVTGCFLLACAASDLAAPAVIYDLLPTRMFMFGFLAGALLYTFRNVVPYSLLTATVSAIVAFVLIALSRGEGGMVALTYPAVALLAYVIAVVGMTKMPAMPFFHRGDYSYGIYIFGFPIQQTIVHFFPAHREWWFNFALSLPITLMFAVASWHIIEKPALSWRKRLLRDPVVPVEPSLWSNKQRALFIFLIVYGLFVSRASEIFPFREMRAAVGLSPKPVMDSTTVPRKGSLPI
jgi:peptidoglycan/LPS O-acetylase OafA/YrhL